MYKVLTHRQKVSVLYKAILKLHRGLPVELKALGDEYAKSEFRRHKDAPPEQANVFMLEWSSYAIDLSKQLGIRGTHQSNTIGKIFSESDLNNFTEEQLGQLHELYKASKPDEKT